MIGYSWSYGHNIIFGSLEVIIGLSYKQFLMATSIRLNDAIHFDDICKAFYHYLYVLT